MKRKRVSRKKQRSTPRREEVRLDELEVILERTKKGALSTEDHHKLAAVVDTLVFVTQQLETKGTTIARLRKLLFGSTSEKTWLVLGDPPGTAGDTTDDTSTDDSAPANDAGADEGDDKTPRKKRRGHGRNGADSYRGADKEKVPHPALEHKGCCPECERGRVYRQREPAVLVRVKGVGPLVATVYELERLRCGLCGEVFTAPSPPGVGDKKYDETAAAMIGLLRYGYGLPFNRLERLGNDLGIPLPSTTQWEVARDAANALEPAWVELIDQAAQGDVIYIDDSRAKILELNELLQKEVASGEGDRTGVFTTGVISTVGQRQIALFFTGRNHAGENLSELLARRPTEQKPPIQMCDALSCNTSGDFDTILANCLSHGRRKFVEVVKSFPVEVRHMLETLREVYRHDAFARDTEMSDDERLHHHQEHSGPLMAELEKWLQANFDDKTVEPNSTLGGAITYMQNHWQALTLFLRVPGAPLDNNICERALKKSIMHRKNSLFYKTENGARVGDMFMSLIHTAELHGANTFEYLVALLRHPEAVEQTPSDWMPWSYTATLAALAENKPP